MIVASAYRSSPLGLILDPNYNEPLHPIHGSSGLGYYAVDNNPLGDGNLFNWIASWWRTNTWFHKYPVEAMSPVAVQKSLPSNPATYIAALDPSARVGANLGCGACGAPGEKGLGWITADTVNHSPGLGAFGASISTSVKIGGAVGLLAGIAGGFLLWRARR